MTAFPDEIRARVKVVKCADDDWVKVLYMVTEWLDMEINERSSFSMNWLVGICEEYEFAPAIVAGVTYCATRVTMKPENPVGAILDRLMG
jgi:hypothetical protein